MGRNGSCKKVTQQSSNVSISGSNFQSQDSGLRFLIPGNPGESRGIPGLQLRHRIYFQILISDLKYAVNCRLEPFSIINYDITAIKAKNHFDNLN